MQDSKMDEDQMTNRKSDATSDETLSDIEETERVANTDSGGDTGPSPDGRLDESDELKDAGPM